MKTFLSRTGSSFEFPSVEFVTFSVDLSKKKKKWTDAFSRRAAGSSGELNLRFSEINCCSKCHESIVYKTL